MTDRDWTLVAKVPRGKSRTGHPQEQGTTMTKSLGIVGDLHARSALPAGRRL